MDGNQKHQSKRLSLCGEKRLMIQISPTPVFILKKHTKKNPDQEVVYFWPRQPSRVRPQPFSLPSNLSSTSSAQNCPSSRPSITQHHHFLPLRSILQHRKHPPFRYLNCCCAAPAKSPDSLARNCEATCEILVS